MTMYLSQKSKENVFSVSVVSYIRVLWERRILFDLVFAGLPYFVVKSRQIVLVFTRYLRNIQAKLMMKILVKTEKHRNKGC